MALKTEARKFRLALLEDVLDSLPTDPVDGLIRLTEFWAKWEYPSDSPHVVQGRGNKLSPVDYYTLDTFARLIAEHRAWVEREAGNLRG